jgi:hypothetical protein
MTAPRKTLTATLRSMIALLVIGCGLPGLRYNQVYQKSAHNTYALDEQLLDVLFCDRVRSIEFDLHVRHEQHAKIDGDWFVYHNASELETNLDRFSSALDRIAAFHRAAPSHEVVTVWLDHEIVEVGDPGHDAAAFDASLRARLGSALFSPSDLVASCRADWHGAGAAPGDPPGTHAAIARGDCGWPLLETLRGRFIFVITSGAGGYANQSAQRAAFTASRDVLTNPNVFFGNFGGGRRFGDAEWRRGLETDAQHFVSRVYDICRPRCGVDSRKSWQRAVANRFHHVATNLVDVEAAPWTRTHNARGYPFCPLGVSGCAQQLLDLTERAAAQRPCHVSHDRGRAADPNARSPQ